MTVKVVTDSTFDIPVELAQELGISVIPLYVVFGDKSYRDGVDISKDEFYDMLIHGSVHPSTSVPSPQDFAETYNKIADETNEIISIHLTSKESGTYNSALLGSQLVEKKCRIEVIDSATLSVGCGLLVIAAAQEARSGATLEQVAEVVRQSIPRTHILILLDTLKYVIRGGRLSKTRGLLGTALRVRPLLTIRDGELVQTGVARTKAKAEDRLYEFATGFARVKDIAVTYTTIHDEAKSLADRIQTAFPEAPLYITRVGATLGTHAGPGAMGIAIRES
ncbi:MAG TPA: DegV family protein [Dehalococcoidia bacterium]|nr:DegV family protein [Dehalococcoidia bacterium]